MKTKLTTIALLATVSFTGVACFDSDEPQEVELVDKRSDEDTNQNPQAVSDSDFEALKKEVEALKAQVTKKADATALNSLDNEVGTLGSSVNSLNTSVNSLNTSVNNLTATKQPTLWLYDGDGTKKYKVMGFETKEPLQIAIVEVKPGVSARYVFNRFGSHTAYEYPLPFSSNELAIYYPSSSCGGTPVLGDLSSEGGYGRGGTLGTNFIYIAADEPSLSNFAFASYRPQSTGSCSNLSGTLSGGSRAVTVEAKTLYQLKNPLTVGP